MRSAPRCLGGVAGLRIDDAPFYLHEASPASLTEESPRDAGVTSARVELFVEEPAAVIERAAANGAVEVEPLAVHEAPWGVHQQGGFTDPFGHRWSFGDHTPRDPFPR